MSAPVPADTRKPQLLTVLFWGGVALAPVAALILLVADGNGPLRFAAVLAIVAVVLIGLSIALRTEGGGEAHAEELREEIDELRRELRGEIVAAAQRGNQALDEAQRVQTALAGLRRQVDAGGGSPVGGEEPPGPGRARVPAPESEAPARYAERPAAQAGVYGTAQAAGPGTGPASGYDDHPANGYDDRRAGGYDVERPAAGHGGDRVASGSAGYGGERPAAGYAGDRPATGSAGVYGSAARPEPDGRSGDPAPRPLGVVRHTETVHVTTRHTIVDGGVGESGTRYGGYATPWSSQQEEPPRSHHGADRDDRSWSDADERSRRDDGRSWSGPAREEERSWSGPARDEERSWSDSRDERPWSVQREDWSTQRDDRAAHRDDRSAHRNDRSAHRDDRDWGASRDERGWDDGGQQWEAAAEQSPPGRSSRPDDTGQYWAQLRAGDRWAAVRDDDRGRELRVGERRAEVHADHAGTEYRVEDRWASVRRDEPRRDESRREAGRDEAWRDGWGEPEDRPALPAGGVPVPDEWRPPRQREYQPESGRGYQPEPARGQRPDPEPYGRRHQAEEAGYGHPAHDGTNRWR
ncbi:hypothetical protein [Micromonospora sp. NPDC051296]|uniref:hypothetical protein n=1 Tax=Micromonospora sp. NPDC051296 TaxID=3155046 RepID=UPI0034253E3E